MAEYIEREAAIKCAEKSYKMWNLTMAAADGEREINKCYKMQDVCKAIGEVFKIVPAADVAPVVHGSWDGTADGCADGELVYDMWSCSVCGFDADGADEKPTWKYCPNCGAKMDGGDTDV